MHTTNLHYRSAVLNENEKQNSVLLLDIEEGETVLEKQTENDTTNNLPINKENTEDIIYEKMQAERNSNISPKKTDKISDPQFTTKCPKCGSPATKTRKVISEYIF